MKPSEQVFIVRDTFVNFFLIRSDEHYIAIDAGNDAEHIRQELDKLNIEAEKILAVFLTHTDSDHTAALSLFENATIYISKAEQQMIDGRTPRFWFIHNPFDYEAELVEDDQVVPRLQGVAPETA